MMSQHDSYVATGGTVKSIRASPSRAISLQPFMAAARPVEPLSRVCDTVMDSSLSAYRTVVVGVGLARLAERRMCIGNIHEAVHV